MRTIKEVIVERDNISEAEADRQIKEAREALYEYLEEGEIEAAEDICGEFFGLEPDYLEELL